MKNCILLLLTLLSATFSFAQFNPSLGNPNPIVTAFPFLNLPIDDQARGMADIGVVAGPDYYGTALWQNPALLYRGKQIIGGKLGALSLDVGNPSQFHSSVYLPVGKRGMLAAGYRSATFRQYSYTNYRDNFEGEMEVIKPFGMQTKVSYGYPLTKNLSMGTGMSFINSLSVQSLHDPHLICDPGKIDSFKTNRWAATADVGLHYQKDFSLSCVEDVRLQWGASVINMGAKVRRGISDLSDYLPTTLRLGGLLGWKKANKEGFTLEMDFAYQMQKLLVPSIGSPNFHPAARAMLSSLLDNPNGLHGEFQEVAHQFGAEWRKRYDDGMGAIRMGFFFEDPTQGNRRYLTFGGTVQFHGFRWDISYLFFEQDEALSGGIIGTFSYVKVLGK